MGWSKAAEELVEAGDMEVQGTYNWVRTLLIKQSSPN